MPTNWNDWANGSGTRVTGIAPQPYAFTLLGGAGASAGIYSPLTGRIATGWHVIEADVTLNSGAFTGAGVYVDWDGGGDMLSFSADVDINGSVIGAGTTGRLYRFRKLIQVTSGTTYNGMYAMSHWSGGSFGSVASANSITWHRCAIRAASQAEIEARQAKLDLVTANANIASNAATSASNAASIASLTTTVSANYTALDAKTNTNQNLMPYPNGTGDNALASTVSWNVFSAPTPTQALYMPFYAPAGGAFYYVIWSSGYNSGGAAYIVYQFPVGVVAGQAYTLSMVGAASLNNVKYSIGARNSGLSDIGFSSQVALQATRNSVSYTMPTGAAWATLVIEIPAQNSAGAYRELTFRNIKFELGSSATVFSQEGDIRQTNTNLATANANIATNASAIATESAARAALSTLVTARVGQKPASILVNPAFSDYPVASGAIPPGWSNWVSGTSSSRGTGRVGQYAHYQDGPAGAAGGLYQYRAAVPGKHQVDATIEVAAGNVTGAGFYIEAYNSSNTYITGSAVAYPFASTPDTNGYTGISPGHAFRSWRQIYTAPAGTAFLAVYLMSHWGGFGAISTYNQILWHQLDVSPASYSDAQVSIIQTALAAPDGSTALVAFEANASGVMTGIKLISVSSGHTTPISQIIMSASDIILAADAINFGSNTIFEDTYDSFYTEAGGKRNRFGGPFPASGDLMEWFGPTSVALNSETKTNGYWAKGVDGKMYYGAAELNTSGLFDASADDPTINLTGFNGTNYTPYCTITASGGTAPYTYEWNEAFNVYGDLAISNASSNVVRWNNTPAFTSSDLGAQEQWVCTVRDAAGRTIYVTVTVDITNSDF